MNGIALYIRIVSWQIKYNAWAALAQAATIADNTNQWIMFWTLHTWIMIYM